MRRRVLPVLVVACIWAQGCGDGGPSVGGPPRSLTLTLDAVPASVEAFSAFSIAGQVGGDARLDSVIVLYEGSHRKTLDRAFSVPLVALRPGARPIVVTAFSSQAAAPAQQSVNHVVTAGTLPDLVAAMYLELGAYIASEQRTLENLLPGNPHLTTQIQAKLAVLSTPTLADDVVLGRRHRTATVRSSDGRELPIALVFMLESMRAEAPQSVDVVEATIPILESFMSIPFPAGSMRVWYGFTMGNRGGGGGMFMEDRTTYEARRTGAMALYDAILAHETAHSYIGNESLTQFLELYAYNLRVTGTTDLAQWTWTRGYVPDRASNAGVHAVLDIYALIGHDASSRAYAKLYTLRPPYGQPLSAVAQQAFVDEAPAAVRDQVAAKAALIGT